MTQAYPTLTGADVKLSFTLPASTQSSPVLILPVVPADDQLAAVLRGLAELGATALMVASGAPPTLSPDAERLLARVAEATYKTLTQEGASRLADDVAGLSD